MVTSLSSDTGANGGLQHADGPHEQTAAPVQAQGCDSSRDSFGFRASKPSENQKLPFAAKNATNRKKTQNLARSKPKQIPRRVDIVPKTKATRR